MVGFAWALVSVMLAGHATSADARSDYPRGPVPAVERHVIERLDSLALLNSDHTIRVRSPLSLCTREPSFSGVALDEKAHGYFAEYYPEIRKVGVGPHLHLIGRVSMGAQLVGYLLAVPGMYDSSAVDLWILDVTRQRWFSPTEVADSWGDAGTFHNSEAWLVDIDGDGYRDIVRRTKERYFDRLIADRVLAWKVTPAGAKRTAVSAPLRGLSHFRCDGE